MCVASDSRTIVVAMLLFVENKRITVRSLGVSGVTKSNRIALRSSVPMAMCLKYTRHLHD